MCLRAVRGRELHTERKERGLTLSASRGERLKVDGGVHSSLGFILNLLYIFLKRLILIETKRIFSEG